MVRRRIPITDLEPPLSDVLAHWRARDGENLACSWRTFDMHLLPPEIIPTTMVIDVFDDPQKNRFRYWGSQMTTIHGADMTGKSPYSLSPTDFAQTLRAHHQEVRDNKTATSDILGFRHDAGFTHIHTVLRLPLSNDGRNVNMIAVVSHYTDEAQAILRENGPNSIDRHEEP